jgi:hypothetical protein
MANEGAIGISPSNASNPALAGRLLIQASRQP